MPVPPVELTVIVPVPPGSAMGVVKDAVGMIGDGSVMVTADAVAEQVGVATSLAVTV